MVVRDLSQTVTMDVILETVFGVRAEGVERANARAVLAGLMSSIAPSLVGGTFFHRRWFPPWQNQLEKVFPLALPRNSSWSWDSLFRRHFRPWRVYGSSARGPKP